MIYAESPLPVGEYHLLTSLLPSIAHGASVPGFLGLFLDLDTFPDGPHTTKTARTLKMCTLSTTTDLNLPVYSAPIWPFPLGNDSFC